ncbi:MAG: diguanylate cyclase [Comamonas sp.]
MDQLDEESPSTADANALSRLQSALDSPSIPLESVYDLSPVALCVLDGERCFVMVNTAFARILCMPASMAEGRPLAALLPELDQLLVARSESAGRGATGFGRDLEIAGRWYHPSIKPLGDPANRRGGLSVALTDITVQKNVEQELECMNRKLTRHAHEDYLTGLYNRRHLDSALRIELGRARREGLPTSILLMDLDHFKQYNDSYGHQAGDACLKRVADTLSSVISRRGDCLGRYGGEEFLAILPSTPAEGALTLAQRIQAAMRALDMPAALMLKDGITLSFGVSTLLPVHEFGVFDVDAVARDLLGCADRALYQAKAAGRNQIVTAPALYDGS